MKHTPACPAHWYLITIENGVEWGTCKVCGAKRLFDAERWHSKKFGMQPIAPKSKPVEVYR